MDIWPVVLPFKKKKSTDHLYEAQRHHKTKDVCWIYCPPHFLKIREQLQFVAEHDLIWTLLFRPHVEKTEGKCVTQTLAVAEAVQSLLKVVGILIHCEKMLDGTGNRTVLSWLYFPDSKVSCLTEQTVSPLLPPSKQSFHVRASTFLYVAVSPAEVHPGPGGEARERIKGGFVLWNRPAVSTWRRASVKLRTFTSSVKKWLTPHDMT